MAALDLFREVRGVAPEDPAGLLGLAETYLFMGRPGTARLYVEEARRALPDDEDATALHVRILIRAAEFDRALKMSTRALGHIEQPGVKLLAAHASALFRVQRTVDSAGIYRQVLAREPLHPEAHLRLGSGLLSPCDAPYVHELFEGIRAQQHGALREARDLFQAALRESPGHPVAHRLLGETVYALRYETSMVRRTPQYELLSASMPVPDVAGLPVDEFLPGFAQLAPERRAVASRALRLFGSLLSRLVALRGRHDLLRADERTTDAAARAHLRGKRTFDGRVWDDVRGIGGLRAATGIEALDEAAQFGFCTLTHEIAHQAHLYAFKPLIRAQIRRLYKDALERERCLDFYAATNDAEYFGQGVEAFVSLAKRPGCEKTHGHTRFELKRRDPELYAFIEQVVEFDPLRDAAHRARLLPLAVDTALLRGCPEDAMVAAAMMDEGPEKAHWLRRARRAWLYSLTY